MNNFEFLEYKTYTVDAADPKTNFNPLASATIRAYGKVVLTYIFKSFKDKPAFWTEISQAVREGGETVYLKGCVIDSRYEDKAAIEFIKENVARYSARAAAFTPTTQGQSEAQVVADQGELPF